MIYLVLSILCSTSVLLVFRIASRYVADSRKTIMVSYAVATILSLILLDVSFHNPWNLWLAAAAVEGVLFYVVFRLIASSAVRSGIALTAVASKMSVIIPVTVGFTLLGEPLNTYVFTGVVCGLISVLLTTSRLSGITNWYWPLLVFAGSGFIDASFKLLQVWGLSEAQFPGFIASVFMFAFLISLLDHHFRHSESLARLDVYAGMCLGAANLGTVYFLLKALAQPAYDSAFIYSLNSFGIVLLTTLLALILFKERLSRSGWLGMVLAVVAIVLLYAGFELTNTTEL